jgi:hypothetical protein
LDLIEGQKPHGPVTNEGSTPADSGDDSGHPEDATRTLADESQ